MLDNFLSCTDELLSLSYNSFKRNDIEQLIIRYTQVDNVTALYGNLFLVLTIVYISM